MANPSIVFPDVDINDDFIDQLLLSTAYTGRARAAPQALPPVPAPDIYDDVLDRLVTTLTGLEVRGGVQLASCK
ncbi:hypothetical protein [Rhodococcus sp. ACS1]|uniref:hypothetical protein n=1 Tax=Rhodococcus sp. ACS1 TaxID=2028570 RepID=UPI00211BCF4D|nr:hypothetical protein [Rhodococcus sp. ACS1]